MVLGFSKPTIPFHKEVSMKRIIFVSFSVIMFLFWYSDLPCQAESAEVKTLVKHFNQVKDPGKKVEILGNILQLKSLEGDLVFYELVEKRKADQLPLFEEAITKHSTCEIYLHMGHYVRKKVEPIIQKAQKLIADHPSIIFQNDPDGKLAKLDQESIRIGNETEEKVFEPLTQAMFLAAPPHAACLARKISAELNSEDPYETLGAKIGILMTGESGFTALLDLFLTQPNSGIDATYLITQIPVFKADSVVPIIKAYENPQNSKATRDRLEPLLLSISVTRECLPRVVDAYFQSPFFPEIKIPDNPADIPWLEKTLTAVKGNKRFCDALKQTSGPGERYPSGLKMDRLQAYLCP